MTAQATGAGFTLSFKTDENKQPVGDVFMTGKDGSVFNADNHLTVADIKESENAFNYMIADAQAAGAITQEQADYMYDNYAKMLNAILDKGVEKNGLSGYERLASAWQYQASSVQRV